MSERMDRMKGGIDRVQRRVAPLAFVAGVFKKFGEDRAGQLAALVAYYGFFSLFPALLSLVTILGFVLQDRPDLRDNIVDSALGQFPVIGESLTNADQPLTGNPAGIILGLLIALWAGLAAMQAAQDAVNATWDVPRIEHPSFLHKRLRSLLMLIVLGGLLIGTTALTQTLAAIEVIGPVSRALFIAGSLVLTAAVFMVAFRVLTVAEVTWKQLIPGSIVAGVGYMGLQLIGQWYLRRVINNAEDTYGTFAIVIGLLTWLYLLAQMTMLGAEVNVVAARHLWPRSLFGPPATEADRVSLESQVKAGQLAEDMEVEVTFSGSTPVKGPEDAAPR